MPHTSRSLKLDRQKIDKKAESEVKHVHTMFSHLSRKQIMNSIEKYGPVRENVYANLKTKRAYK